MNSQTESTFCFVIFAHKVVSLMFIFEQLENHSETQSCRFLPAVKTRKLNCHLQLFHIAAFRGPILVIYQARYVSYVIKLHDLKVKQLISWLEHLIPRIFSDGNSLMLHDASKQRWQHCGSTVTIPGGFFHCQQQNSNWGSHRPWHIWTYHTFGSTNKRVENSWSLGLTQLTRPAFHQW